MRRRARVSTTSTTRLAGTLVAVAITASACGGAGGDSGGATLEVVGTDALEFAPAELSAPAGTITIELTAEETVEHTFVIEDLDDTEVVSAAAGETTSGSVEVEAGSYTFYCSVPGHREAGMEGELNVAS